jgi:hypothetical protein
MAIRLLVLQAEEKQQRQENASLIKKQPVGDAKDGFPHLSIHHLSHTPGLGNSEAPMCFLKLLRLDVLHNS